MFHTRNFEALIFKGKPRKFSASKILFACTNGTRVFREVTHFESGAYYNTSNNLPPLPVHYVFLKLVDK